MQVVALRTLKQIWAAHPEAEMPLRAWYAKASGPVWRFPQDIKTEYGAAVDFVGDNRIVFDIAGNKYRLVVHVSYLYPVHERIRKSPGDMTRKLSLTRSQSVSQFFGTSSRRKLSMDLQNAL